MKKTLQLFLDLFDTLFLMCVFYKQSITQIFTNSENPRKDIIFLWNLKFQKLIVTIQYWHIKKNHIYFCYC